MLCFPLRLFNVPALAVGLVLYYTLSLESINLIPNPNTQVSRVQSSPSPGLASPVPPPRLDRSDYSEPWGGDYEKYSRKDVQRVR